MTSAPQAPTWVILNARSAAGQTGRRRATLVERIRRALGAPVLRWTEGPGHAATLAAEARAAGAACVVAVGGDGTVSETADGLLGARGHAGPVPALGVVAMGTGSDFVRSLGLPRGLDAQLAVLRAGAVRPIDVGFLHYRDAEGREASRRFVNTASAGMSGLVCAQVNRMRLGKRFGGRLAFQLASLRVLARHDNRRVRLTLDDGSTTEGVANTVAVCNGRFFGGGMQIAPHAGLTSGHLEVVTLGDLGWFEALRAMPSLYRGRHLAHPKVWHARARTVRIDAVGGPDLPLEVDGEAPGLTPAVVTVLPGALEVVAPARARAAVASRRPSP